MITAVFTDNSDYARATGLWQWDYGQRLRIEGLKLPTAVEIHFALTEQSGDAITRVGTTQDGVTEVVIPDSLLENQAAGATYEIYAWIYLADKTSGETIKRISVQVKRRPKPEGHDTPEDAELFRDAIAQVNASADRAETAREGAEAAQKAAEAAAGKIEGEITGAGQIAEQVKQDAAVVADDRSAVSQLATETAQNAQKAAEAAQAAERSSTAAKEAQTAAESAKAGATAAMEEVERDRVEVSETHKAVEQMRGAVDTDRQAVAADRQAVENTALQFGQAAQSAINAVGQAQEAAVGAVSAEGQRQTTAVQQAGTQAVSGVAEAKTTAVQAVTTEGDTQTNRVQDAAAGIVADREQIAANKQAIEGKVDKQQGADNAGKALVVGKDGNVELGDAQTKTDPTLTQSGQAADAQVTGREIATLHQGKADAIVETAQGDTMTLTDSSDKLFEGLRVFGKSTQDGTPSVENPVPIVNAGENGSITVEVTGRNLLKPNPYNTYYEFPLKANTVMTLMTNGKPSQGGNIKFSATDGSDVWFSIDAGQTRVCRSIGNKDVKGFYDVLKVIDGLEYMFAVGDIKTYTPYVEPQSLTLATPNGLPGIPVTKDGNYTDQNGQQWICDEIDLGRGKYVQRVGKYVFDGTESMNDSWLPTIVVNMRSDGLARLRIDGGLLSNYGGVTFSNNTGKSFSFNSAKWGVSNGSELKELLKTKSDSGSPVIVQYVLVTPIERDLTPEELAAYEALHTNYPTTVITNDAGAHMEASYVADTGTYIRNMESRLNAKLVNIQSALISQKISGGGIKVTDSSRVPVVRFVMWGKTEQVRTTGAQLLPEQETLSVYITTTANKCGFTGSGNDYAKVIENTENATYYVFRKNAGTRFRVAYADIVPTGAMDCVGVNADTQDNTSIEVPAGKVLIINMENEQAFEGLMVQKTSKKVPYEPYSGGKPSPSPDWEQPIEITDQPVTVTVKGGTEQQSITLIPPRPFTKWDKLEKVDGVWCWAYQSEHILSYSAESITGEYFSTTGELSTGAEVYYKADVPENIPLSPSEQAQLNALMMYAGTTEVTNTGGCNMELTYTVDTKSYVDSKIAAISAAVLEV